MPVFTAIIHSTGPSAVDYCEDSYEITAETAQVAIDEAKLRFKREILPRWPDLCIEDAFVVPAGADPNEFEPETDTR